MRNAGCLVAALLALCVVAAIQVAAQEFPLVAVCIVGAGLATYATIRKIRDRRAVRRLGAQGWQSAPAGQSWPWLPLLARPGATRVLRAWSRTVDGLPVTAGELTWDDNVLDGSVEGWRGRGVFVVVRLPAPTEPMALRRPHRTVGTSHRLESPALHAAYAAGEIPPWTAKDDCLFTFTAFQGQLRADALEAAVRRTLLVVRLLDLGPE